MTRESAMIRIIGSVGGWQVQIIERLAGRQRKIGRRRPLAEAAVAAGKPDGRGPNAGQCQHEKSAHDVSAVRTARPARAASTIGARPMSSGANCGSAGIRRFAAVVIVACRPCRVRYSQFLKKNPATRTGTSDRPPDRKTLRQLADAEHERIVLRIVRENFELVVVIDSEAAGDVARPSLRHARQLPRAPRAGPCHRTRTAGRSGVQDR